MMTVAGHVKKMECGVSPVNQTVLVSALANDQAFICYINQSVSRFCMRSDVYGSVFVFV